MPPLELEAARPFAQSVGRADDGASATRIRRRLFSELILVVVVVAAVVVLCYRYCCCRLMTLWREEGELLWG